MRGDVGQPDATGRLAVAAVGAVGGAETVKRPVLLDPVVPQRERGAPVAPADLVHEVDAVVLARQVVGGGEGQAHVGRGRAVVGIVEPDRVHALKGRRGVGVIGQHVHADRDLVTCPARLDGARQPGVEVQGRVVLGLDDLAAVDGDAVRVQPADVEADVIPIELLVAEALLKPPAVVELVPHLDADVGHAAVALVVQRLADVEVAQVLGIVKLGQREGDAGRADRGIVLIGQQHVDLRGIADVIAERAGEVAALVRQLLDLLGGLLAHAGQAIGEAVRDLPVHVEERLGVVMAAEARARFREILELRVFLHLVDDPARRARAVKRG